MYGMSIWHMIMCVYRCAYIQKCIPWLLLCHSSPSSLEMGFSADQELYNPELTASKRQQLSCRHHPHGAVVTGTPAAAPGF